MNKTKVTPEEIAEHLDMGEDSAAIANAYLQLGITTSETAEDIASEIEEAYQGKFISDEDFAQEISDQLDYVDIKNQPWPQYCIDWEYAARELMMDYSEQDGYYFRNI